MMNILELEYGVAPVQGYESGSHRQGKSVENGGNSQAAGGGDPASGSGEESAPMDRDAAESLAAEVQASMAAKGIDLQFKVHDDTGVVQVEVLDPKNDTVVHKFPPDSLLKFRKQAGAQQGFFLNRSF